ncbi:response regulator [Gramella sp. AN32]|uniref:Response regulator n=1 Tax=Christiangramia antarctica TaxID=2058158 RepID=A0ABW5XB20_9FLAO|nr:response regulator [Gramella sp. AN32]MCM4155358.1 response regulator [Gramella sp. AN32]
MSKSVWIIDDDEIYQMIIKKIITQSEIFNEFEYFLSAKAAIERLKKRAFPDVILVDINMPIMDGWQFLDYLRKEFRDELKNSLIFIVSSSIAYSDIEKAENYKEISGFITKPVNWSNLKMIENMIKRSI